MEQVIKKRLQQVMDASVAKGETPGCLLMVIKDGEEQVYLESGYADIEAKKLSFSAGQYFEVKIEYVELTPEEFAEKMTGFTARLDEMFAESLRLESEIKTQLGRVKYE